MQQKIASLLLLSALGASAHPSGHARFHNRQARQADVAARSVGDVVTATINGDVVSWTQTDNYGAAAATPKIKAGNPIGKFPASSTAEAEASSSTAAAAVVAAPSSASSSSTAAAAKATSTPAASSSGSSSSSSGSGVTSYTTFKDACKSSSSKRATLAEIAYTGNVGTQYGAYGCNYLLVGSSDVASKYDNTVKFFGASQDQTCILWNKIGVDGGINGFWGADAKTFDLAAGQEQWVAFDKNSQGGGACFPKSSGVQKTASGQIAGTWAEWDFENSSNNGWSGADASCIVAQDGGKTVFPLQVCAGSTCSTIASGASSVVNAFDYSLRAADGLGINSKGPLRITVNVGYSA